MDSFDIKGCIKTITATVNLIMDEMAENRKVIIIQKEKLPIYSTILVDIIKILHEFDKLENYKILSHHALSFSIIKIINLDLFEINDDFKIIKNYETLPKKDDKCYFCMSRVIEENRPSYIKKKIDTNFDKIYVHLKNLEKLKNNIFGSAYRIKHPVLQKIWLLSCLNDLNNSTIDKNLFLDNTYNLYKIYCMNNKNNVVQVSKTKNFLDEIIALCSDSKSNKYYSDIIESYNLEKEEEKVINNKIELLFNKLNKNSDNTLSIIELNSIDTHYNQYDNIKDFLYSFKEYSESTNENSELINTNDGPYELLGNSKKDKNENKLLYDGYGSDFANKFLFTFKMPEKESFKDKEYQYIQCFAEAEDQGWGGNGHVHVILRFESASKKNHSRFAFAINRNNESIVDNIYSFKITQDEIDTYQMVSIYLVCPMWSGWEGKITNFTAKLYF